MSPHLIKYNERISINGNLITDNELSILVEELKPKIEKFNNIHNVNITLFELETILALLYFYRNNVDFVVLETGLGGLYDCTNIISKPLVSIITSIGFDHMHILGNTLPEIAEQKAGIIKENSNTIFFEQSKEINDIFIKTCKEKNNKLYLLKKSQISNYSYDNNFQYFDFDNFKKIEVILKGKKQIQNACLCIKCMQILNEIGYKISEYSIREGLKTVIHKGRMEILSKKPLIIFDGAHNEPAIQNLKDMVNMYYKNSHKTFIISILKTKDYNTILKLLLEDENAEFIFTSGNNNEKYVSKETLYQIALNYKKNQILYKMDLEKALKFIKEKPSSINFIVGSFYVYGDVLNLLK